MLSKHNCLGQPAHCKCSHLSQQQIELRRMYAVRHLEQTARYHVRHIPMFLWSPLTTYGEEHWRYSVVLDQIVQVVTDTRGIR